jgi:TetR/AcrR family transcriptional repressor of uid operon
MSPKVSSQYKTEIRERIIKSAVTAFSKYGFDKARMDDISAESNISKGTLYLYFKSKEELFFAICENNNKKLKEQLSMLFVRDKRDLIQNAELFYDSFQKLVDIDDQKVYLEIMSECSRDRKLQKLMLEQRLKIINIVKRYLDLQVKVGLIRDDVDVSALASGLVSLYDGLTLNKVMGIENDFNKKSWTETIKAIFTSITCR